jgi:hypothetical protein
VSPTCLLVGLDVHALPPHSPFGLFFPLLASYILPSAALCFVVCLLLLGGPG